MDVTSGDEKKRYISILGVLFRLISVEIELYYIEKKEGKLPKNVDTIEIFWYKMMA